ncbi:MAG TPA: hypothetical protein VHW00_01050 [Thermoanaerobaculia bacterium]|nr:hypothetical protein [Thermoanaerobaculia bacterium]
MALKIEAAPERGLEVVRENLMLPHHHGFEAMNVIDGEPSVRILTPYPIYTARLSSLLAGTFLKSAQVTSWQYVIVNAGRVLAEVAAAGLEFSSLQNGPVADALLDAIRAAENLELTRTKDYELRILRAPELYLLAVWLYSAAESWLLPIRPAPVGLQPGALLSESQLVEALHPLAERRGQPA